jgi:PAS domain-containing protein
MHMQTRLHATVSRVRQGNTVRFIETMHTADRQLVLSVTAKPVRNAADAVTQILLEMNDITGLRQAEQAALLRAHQVEAILDALTDGIVVLDATGAIERLNAAGSHLLGLSEVADAVGTLPLAEQGSWVEMRDSAGQILPFERLPTHRVLQGDVLTGSTAIDIETKTPHGTTHQLTHGGPRA